MKVIIVTIIFIIITSVSLFSQGGVGINRTGNLPDPSAMLDIDADDKGVLIPRVALNSLTDVVTVPSPTTSLLVYNNGSGGLATTGYYYWDGTQWIQVGAGTGSDDQNLTSASLSGTTLQINIENGNSVTVDLQSLFPVGAVMAFNSNTCPTGWVKANGQNGTPDLRGEFVRGLDDGRGIDASRTLASNQSDELKSHSHTVNPPATNAGTNGAHVHSVNPPSTATSTNGAHSHSLTALQFSDIDGVSPSDNVRAGGDNNNRYTQSVAGDVISTSGNHTHTVDIPAFNSVSSGDHTHSVDISQFNSGSTGGAETRPRNVALLYCIKQ